MTARGRKCGRLGSRRTWSLFARALVLVLGLPAAHANTAQRAWQLAVVPQNPPIVMHRQWEPLVAALAAQVNHPIELQLAPSIPAFESALANGAPDLAFMNPYHAFKTHNRAGYVPLVRDGANPLVGILVVRRDSAIRTPLELAGRRVAFPAPNAFAASLYMRALLATEFGLGLEPRYVGTHANVYRHVVLGRAAAGGGIRRTLAQEPEALRDELRVIFETPPVAPHPLCANPRLDAATREQLVTALEAIYQDPKRRPLLAAVGITELVRADYERDYAPLERLDIERFAVVSSP